MDTFSYLLGKKAGGGGSGTKPAPNWISFAYYPNTSIDLSWFDKKNLTSLTFFLAYSNLTSFKFEGFNEANITSAERIFAGSSELLSIDMGDLDTSNITYWRYAFNGCSSLTSLDLSGHNITGVTNAERMFHTCSNLTNLNLSTFEFDDSGVEADFMFYGCSHLEVLRIDRLNLSKFSNLSRVFQGVPTSCQITVRTSSDADKLNNIGYNNVIIAQ